MADPVDVPPAAGTEAVPGSLSREDLLKIARNTLAAPAALNVVARETGVDDEVFLALVRNPRTPDNTLVYLGLVGPPAVLHEMAIQAVRIQANPFIGRAILENPDADDALRARVRTVLEGKDADAAARPIPFFQLIKGMSVGQRLALAMKGNKEARMILVKDPNEMVALEVIFSPRITDTEIIAIAQMRDVHEQVLRTIASNKQYRANKQIVWALLNNPKTPPGISTGLNLGNLSEKELEQLAKNRNIPSALQRAARSALERKRRRTGRGVH